MASLSMRRTINKGTARGPRRPSPAAATAVAVAGESLPALPGQGPAQAIQTCAASATMSPQFEKRVEQPKQCAV